AVCGAPGLFEQIAIEIFVPHEDIAQRVENGGVLQRSKECRERRTLRHLVECSHCAFLDVRVTVLQRAKNGRKGAVISTLTKPRGGRRPDSPILVEESFDEPAKDVLAFDAPQREKRGAPKLEIVISQTTEQDIAH